MILRVHKPIKRRRLYETASWYTEVELAPGDYEVEALGPLPYFRHVSIPGTITDEHFPSGFGGMYYANRNDGKNVGKDTTYVMQLPDSCDKSDSEYGNLGRERFNKHNAGEMELV